MEEPSDSDGDDGGAMDTASSSSVGIDMEFTSWRLSFFVKGLRNSTSRGLFVRGGSFGGPPIPNELAMALDPLVVRFNQLGFAARGGLVVDFEPFEPLEPVLAGRDVVED